MLFCVIAKIPREDKPFWRGRAQIHERTSRSGEGGLSREGEGLRGAKMCALPTDTQIFRKIPKCPTFWDRGLGGGHGGGVKLCTEVSWVSWISLGARGKAGGLPGSLGGLGS